MTARPPRRTRPPLQAFLLGALLFAWLAAQSLGLAHRSLHGGALALPSAAATPAPAHGHAHAGLFAGHAHAGDCQLFDHASAADLLAGGAMLAVAAFWSAPFAALLRAGLPARAAPPFQARAPPFLR
ncbi:hypothetical protein [Pseudorhodoferax sp. Leaf267]|uniref:hypothetical protein n=1 Tax=Pseudorhodoferax sp. Leaf267 TaxID=1736316 RepID=UPI0006FACB80|nr:hypothetical protein [Pseudorhodoferax sp. Leaf267]KQP19785.1 hypothetical protein ASF43_28555 [Pseudorhodoferax sp. Leaf267]